MPATVTRIGRRPKEKPVGEMIAIVQLQVAILQGYLEARFGRRRLGRTINGYLADLSAEISEVRAAYRREVDTVNAQVDEIESLLQQRGVLPPRRPTLTLVTGDDDDA